MSWYQEDPGASFRLIEEAELPAGARVLDVGGGTSRLVDRLLARGFRPGLLDISPEPLRLGRARVGAAADRVEWFQADVTSFRSPHPWDLWHDRALLHFLTRDEDRDAYLSSLLAALGAGGRVVIGTFAPDAPPRCSDLPVRRYDITGLEAFLGPEFVLETRAREEHATPAGTIQPFTFGRFRRRIRG